MATVQRANVILDISDDADVIQRYKDKGYDVIDSETGKVIERAMPHESGALQAMVLELQERISILTDQMAKKDIEIDILDKELQKLKRRKKSE